MMLPNDNEVNALFNEVKELCKKNNITLGWIDHSYYVANIAKCIAKKLNMDERFAYIGGLFHDIGRCLQPSPNVGVHFHEIAGYKFMVAKGYPEFAKFCLTHGFVDKSSVKNIPHFFQDIDESDINFYFDFLEKITLDDYDKLIELSDNLAVKEGYVTLEQRIIDLMKRHKYGDVSHWLSKFDEVLNLKKYFDEKLGCSVYEVIPNFIEESLKFKYSN